MSINNQAPDEDPTSLSYERPFVFLFFIFYCLLIIRNAWVCDDAYITLRTVDNFIHGYGLTWNTAERVQVYTHPLWMLCLSGLYFVTREAYFTTLIFSLLLSASVAYLMAFRMAVSAGGAILSLVAITLSKAFLDYSTSGLENPLTHLFLVLFLLVYYRSEPDPTDELPNRSPHTRQWLFRLACLASLAAMNRLDTVLFFVPALITAFIQVPRGGRVSALVKGFLPLIVWEGFAIVYYGFPFPNTAYAKLNTSISSWEMIFQGFCYLLNSLRLDPLTLTFILIGLAAPIWLGNRQLKAFAWGIGLYLAYVVWIGGDFMSGRFLTSCLVGAVALMALSWNLDLKYTVIPLILVFLIALHSPHSQYLLDLEHPLSQQYPVIDKKGIADERAYYDTSTGLINISRQQPLPYHPWILEGRDARDKRAPLVVREDVGLFGFYAGPEVHVLDKWALADPLLTRLPMASGEWRVGHYPRKIPEGYLATLETGQSKLVSPGIAQYYSKIALITRGSLFSLTRLVEILRMNLGYYRDLVYQVE
jgi:arabinofuranosyltransferase